MRQPVEFNAESTSWVAKVIDRILAVPLSLLAACGMTVFLRVAGASAPIGMLVVAGTVAAVWWCVAKLLRDTNRFDEDDDLRNGLARELGLKERVLPAVAWRFREQIRSAIGRLSARVLGWLAWPFGSRDAEQPFLAVEVPARPSSTFSDFHDPFVWGTAAERSLPELVTYSFAALEAWARDHACPRAANQTPSEFAVQIGRQTGSLAAPTRDFARM